MENQIQKVEESSAVVLRRQGKKHLLTDLGTDLKNFNDKELKIINARQVGISLCDLTQAQFEVSLTGILFQVSVICGCDLPTHDAHINALEKEFGIFLNDNGFSGLTTEEVLLAFRMNSNGELPEEVKSYGKIFNIEFASRVLRQYRDKRGRVDLVAEGVFSKREADAELAAEDLRRRLKVIAQFEKFLSDESAELDLADCFMQLRFDGAFSNKVLPDDGSNYFRGSDPLQRLLNSFEGLDSRFEKERETVRYLFSEMKKSGKKKIYDEDFKLCYPRFELPERFETKNSKNEF